MHNSQDERSHSFVKNVIKRNGHMAGEHKASLRERQNSQQMHSSSRDYQAYLQHLDNGDNLENFVEPSMTEQNIYNYAQNDYGRYVQQPASRGGGGGDYKQVPNYANTKYYHNECVQHKKSQTDVKQRKSDETFSQCFSDRSDSTKQTALKKQTTNGKQLMDFVSSKVSLQRTIEDGITGVDKKHHTCSCVPTSTANITKNLQKVSNTKPKLCYSESEEDLQCSTSQSAELINEKIIHPMVKKFRLLYLHNIREEVGIMEDLEKLPSKLAKFCNEMEKNS